MRLMAYPADLSAGFEFETCDSKLMFLPTIPYCVGCCWLLLIQHATRVLNFPRDSVMHCDKYSWPNEHSYRRCRVLNPTCVC